MVSGSDFPWTQVHTLLCLRYFERDIRHFGHWNSPKSPSRALCAGHDVWCLQRCGWKGPAQRAQWHSGRSGEVVHKSKVRDDVSLDWFQGKIAGKPKYLMVKAMISYRCSLQPIQWMFEVDSLSLEEACELFIYYLMLDFSEAMWSCQRRWPRSRGDCLIYMILHPLSYLSYLSYIFLYHICFLRCFLKL